RVLGAEEVADGRAEHRAGNPCVVRRTTRGWHMPVERTRPLPVVVGGGQTTDRPADPLAGREPLALMVEAATRAADDAGGGRALLAAVDTVAVVNVICWSYGDAAGLLADRLGCGPGRRINTHIG